MQLEVLKNRIIWLKFFHGYVDRSFSVEIDRLCILGIYLSIFFLFCRMKNSLLLILFLFSFATIHGQSPAQKLIDNSIQYHDPDNKWDSWNPDLSFTVLYPGKPDGKRSVRFDNKKEEFNFVANYKEGKLVYSVKQGQAKATWNDSETIPESAAKQYRISTDRALMYRNYYVYLYGMPMKLNDPGTQIEPSVELVDFYGKKYNKIRVTYDQSVGKDTWYFYFDPATNALQAYQFFKDESKNDGEYILFEGEIIKDGIKIPKDRKWYYNNDGKYLATDVLD